MVGSSSCRGSSERIIVKFVRYIAVQLSAYGIDMAGFLIAFNLFGRGVIISNILGKILAGIFAFFAHRSFTFGVASEENKSGRQAVMYFLLLALNVPLSSAALSLVLLVVTPAIAAKVIADVICVFLTYWLSKKYVFAERHQVSLGSVPPGRDGV